MSNRIEVGTKCIIREVPGEGLYADLKGTLCAPSEKNTDGGARGTGTQLFDLTGKTGCGIFGNGDSGFRVEPLPDRDGSGLMQ